MPLPRLENHYITQQDREDGKFVVHNPPLCSFPALKSHISPPLAVINGGPKLVGLDLEAISLMYHGENGSLSKTDLAATTERLTLLNKIWGLITGATEAAEKWEDECRGKKRKRDPDDDNHEVDTSAQRTRPNTRSSMKSIQSEPTREAIGGTPRSKNSNFGARKRGGRDMLRLHMTLTGDVLARLGKCHNDTDRIKEWLEVTSSAWSQVK